MRVKAHELWGCKRSETVEFLIQGVANGNTGASLFARNVTFARLRPPTEWCKSRSALAYLRLHYLCTHYMRPRKEKRKRNRNIIAPNTMGSFIQKFLHFFFFGTISKMHQILQLLLKSRNISTCTIYSEKLIAIFA